MNEREFSKEEREDFSKKGLAMSDGSYPIINTSDLKNAIQAFGRTGENKAKTKQHIMKRAKELNQTNLIPDNWTLKESKFSSDDNHIPSFDEYVKTKKGANKEDEDDNEVDIIDTKNTDDKDNKKEKKKENNKDGVDTGKLTKDTDISTESPPDEEEDDEESKKKEKEEKLKNAKTDIISLVDYLKTNK